MSVTRLFVEGVHKIDVIKVSVEEVVNHLKKQNKFGLITKPHKLLNEGAVLGLQLKR